MGQLSYQEFAQQARELVGNPVLGDYTCSRRCQALAEIQGGFAEDCMWCPRFSAALGLSHICESLISAFPKIETPTTYFQRLERQHGSVVSQATRNNEIWLPQEFRGCHISHFNSKVPSSRGLCSVLFGWLVVPIRSIYSPP